MLRRLMFGWPVFAAVVMLFASSAATQPPGDKKGKGGPKGGAAKFELGQVLPPALLADLNLTTEQMKELDALKADLKTKLEKLLTDEQKKKVEAYRPFGPGSGDKAGKGKKGPPPMPVEEAKNDAAIQWFATLSRGLAEAERTGKPILFCSAAPHCAGVSGMW
jgi:hypothetical protein